MDTQAAAETLEGVDHGNGKPHILVVPFPAQGHMLALLDLAALLATSGELMVTVAVTAGNAVLLDPLRASCPSMGVVTLPFPSSPLLPAGCGENTKDLPFHLFLMFLPSLAALRAPLLSWCRAQRHRVTGIVSDMFMGWARPRRIWAHGTALYVAMACHLWSHMRRRTNNIDDDDELAIVFPNLPGAPSFAWRQLSAIYRNHKDGDKVSEAIRQILLWSFGSEYIVVNSFMALEAGYLEPQNLAEPRVLAVGPLSEAWANSGDRGGKPSVPASTVPTWLDAFNTGSVVYVNFGTQHALSKKQDHNRPFIVL
ncbi:hypothetical protein HU200_058262 [Digitaria exilis]|uniref:UDP-glycosyltransferase n=1 Tax=Digitaria exilis TaxID=1010633 RepID=A0A835E4A3_9POAL|nr:hypothetical protein HU200_058262 [Digitaria exilis]